MRKSIYTLLLIAAISSCKKDDPQPTDPGPTTPTIPTEFQAFVGLFDGEGVGAMVNLTEDILLLFNQEGTQYAWFEDQEIKVINDVDASDSHFANAAFETVGAAALTQENRVYIFDEQGENYTSATFDKSEVLGSWNDEDLFTWSSGAAETWQFGPDNTIPITRVSAILTISDPGSNCFDATETYDLMWFADGNGDKLAQYSVDQFAWTGEVIDTEDYTAENNCGGMDGLLPFGAIGAASRYIKPSLIQDIIFNEDGTQFCYYTVSEGIFSEVYDLY